MPVAKYPLILQKSENQEQPAMLQLSTELCAGSEVTVLEPKPVGKYITQKKEDYGNKPLCPTETRLPKGYMNYTCSDA